MRVREIGIIVGSIPIICLKFESEDISTDEDLHTMHNISKCAYISSILTFAERFGSKVEYFESGKQHIVFNKNTIENKQKKQMDIYTYLIIEKEKNFEKLLEKKIRPFLEELLSEFKSQYSYQVYAEVSQFQDFSNIIEQKVKEKLK
ncbi:MAG: hypothetical protein BAJALOKI1v1_640014 [Promethearchaeota archaeon]|nr:MAG: hypothetical protein BAJALOKI1v1_640014 [Candidatus Lokiarchaeota archaeon]